MSEVTVAALRAAVLAAEANCLGRAVRQQGLWTLRTRVSPPWHCRRSGAPGATFSPPRWQKAASPWLTTNWILGLDDHGDMPAGYGASPEKQPAEAQGRGPSASAT
jgi:hypothetical protein